MKVNQNLLAIGFSSGTIVVYDLSEEAFEERNRFSFHRSAVTCLCFSDDNTQLVSGSQDTYIVVYDLIADQAQFKLLGHKDHITQLQTFSIMNPYLKGLTQEILLTSSKDGFLKLWDLSQ